MFTEAEKLITIRNLKPKKKDGFLKVISIFSFLGIMLGVATLIIVMSVMNGFRTELTDKILGFNPHITVKPYDTKINPARFYNSQLDLISENLISSNSGESIILKNDRNFYHVAEISISKNLQNLRYLFIFYSFKFFSKDLYYVYTVLEKISKYGRFSRP